MIDIVTVVFDEELSILRCQAQSVALFCRDLDIKNIYVMINEDDLVGSIDPRWWGDLSHHVRLVPRQWCSVAWTANGWLNQQLLKMLGAMRSTNPWSMVLDAKTVLTNPITRDLLINSAGTAAFGHTPISPVFHPARDIANAVFGVENDHILMPTGVPFLFHNQSLREMVDWIESSTQSEFGQWFLSQGMLTEFVLYSAWILSDPARRRLYHADAMQCSLRIYHCCHIMADRFDEILTSHDDHGHTLSVHRKVWQGLSTEQKQRFRSRLIARGISMAEHLQ